MWRFVIGVFEHIYTNFVEHGPYCEADSRLPSEKSLPFNPLNTNFGPKEKQQLVPRSQHFLSKPGN